MTTTAMIAPTPGQTFTGSPSGATYKADNNCRISAVLGEDVLTMLNAGCQFPEGGSSAVPVTIIGSSGASQTLAFAAEGDIAYDVTLSANCTFTIGAPPAAADYARLILIIRPAGYQATLPPSSSGVLAYSGGAAPTPSTNAITVITYGSDGTAPVFGGL